MNPIQLNFFEVAPTVQPKPPKGMRCRDCKHCYQHQYNENKYCSKQRQKGTSYGHKKIKSLDSAMQCPFFESKLPGSAKLFISK